MTHEQKYKALVAVLSVKAAVKVICDDPEIDLAVASAEMMAQGLSLFANRPIEAARETVGEMLLARMASVPVVPSSMVN